MTGAVVVPCVTRMTDDGYVGPLLPAWDDFPGDDLVAATRADERVHRARVLEMPEQYLWTPQALQDAPARRAGRLPGIDGIGDNPPMRLQLHQDAGRRQRLRRDRRRAPAAFRWGASSGARSPIGTSASAPTRSCWSSRPPRADVDFRYRIFNADGGEVEQCGNGARCFVRFVRDQGLTDKRAIRVETLGGVIEPRLEDDGRVTVDMGAPVFEPRRFPFDARAMRGASGARGHAVAAGGRGRRPLGLGGLDGQSARGAGGRRRRSAPVRAEGPLIENHPRVPAPRECRLHAGGRRRHGSGCASGSAAPARRWPAAPAHAPRW